MISKLTFIISDIIVKTMDPVFSCKIGSGKCKQRRSSKLKIFYFILACAILISLIQSSHAQANSEEQVTISGNLLNDPMAQDILKKIEQTKKMISELKEKEFEKNQAQENLEKMRDMSIERLNQDLDEWERLWEKHSSRNAFDSFVSKKPEYVQGVFWDQFEFKEMKVSAGRAAMGQVLAAGGTIRDANDAYYEAASTRKIELIEMNAQFNVKHNLAYYDQQQLFNSTGQFHPSPAAKSSIVQYYTDYRLDPTYLLANPNDEYSAEYDSNETQDVECGEGRTLIHRADQDDYVCIQDSTAQIWERHQMGEAVDKAEVDVDENSTVQNVPTNPGTICIEGHSVLYNIPASEYRCVSESTANKWTDDGTGEVHDLIQYILGKDQYKKVLDEIYEINQEIQRINEEYDDKIKRLESRYSEDLENADLLAKQKIQEIIEGYDADEDGDGVSENHRITDEETTDRILEIREANDFIKEKMLKEKTDSISKLESERREKLLDAVAGYEGNPKINMDWEYLDEERESTPSADKEDGAKVTRVSRADNNDGVYLDNIGVINSFGQEFDEIKPNQILQIAADIANPKDYRDTFVYMVEITDDENIQVQPTKWITGELNPDQMLNVSVSWVPQRTGNFNAVIFIGTEMGSISRASDIEINVGSESDVSDDDYCKDGHELLFKYSDSSPICATPVTATKLINIGLAFS